MLEILFLVYLCKQLGRIARDKARSAGGYQFMLVACWLIGELGGGTFASAFFQSNGPVYLFALLGAAVSATITFAIVKNLAPLNATTGPRGFPVTPRSNTGDASTL